MDVLEFAVQIAREAGSLTLGYFGSERLGVETKGDGSPVTRADREAEELLRGRIEEAYPEDGILGEEFGKRPGSSERVWILDPIDGTISFSRGVPLFGNMVAIEEHGEAVAGAICLPALGEMVFAGRGQGATWVTGLFTAEERSRPARVSAVDRLDEALLLMTSVRGFERAGRPDLEARLREVTGRQRGWGDCYGHLLVATGRAEIMVDPFLAPWDTAPLKPIVEEAGGAFMTLAGEPGHRGGSGVSTNGALTAAVRGLLQA